MFWFVRAKPLTSLPHTYSRCIPRGPSVWAFVGALAPQPRLVLWPRCHNVHMAVFAQRVLGSGGVVVKLILEQKLNNFIAGLYQIETCCCMEAPSKMYHSLAALRAWQHFLHQFARLPVCCFWLLASPCLLCAMVLHRVHHSARWAV